MSETTSRIVEATFKTPQISDWEIHRQLITRLYKEERKPLREVMSILHRHHGFHATTRQYKQRLMAWNLNKNYKSEDTEVLLRHCTKEELQNALGDGRDSSLMLQGRILSRSLVLRQLRRMRLSEKSADEGTYSLTWSRPNNGISAPPGTLPKHTARDETVLVCGSPGCTPADQGFATIDDLERHQKTVPDECTGPNRCDEPPALEVNSPPPHLESRISTPSASTSYLQHRGYQDSDSLKGPSASTSYLTNVQCTTQYTTQYTTQKSANEYDEEESDARRKRRRITATSLASSLETKALACPFYKHNTRRYNPQNGDMDSAMRYRTCAGPGWESISRLRQHLFRAHVAPKHCCRKCNSVLHCQSDLENHARNCRGSVSMGIISALETISENQQKQLKQKQLPNLTKEESWMRIYRVLFPHDSGTPSPYYQHNDERLKDATLASLPLGQPLFQIQQIDSLVQHLCKTLPEKVSARWQGQSISYGLPTLTEALNAPAPGLADDTDQQCQRAQTVPRTGIRESNSAPVLASLQELKRLISEGVLETCTEWLRTCNEQVDDSDQEDSEDDNEQGHPSTSLANGEGLSLAPITTVPDQWSWYAGTEREGISAIFSDFSMSSSSPRHTHPSHAPWATLPLFDLHSALDSDFSTASATPYGSVNLQPPSAQATDSSIQPGMAQSSDLEGTLVAADVDIFGDWRLWGQTSMPAQIATTLPEANQDP